jgi:hypothetical protein
MTPRSDALSGGKCLRATKKPCALEGSAFAPTCTRTYREWRDLGASIAAALIRAGEAAKEEEGRDG